MAIPFVQSIDMNDFQILNFVMHSAGSAPTNSSTLGGMMWWDSTNYDAKVYNNNDSSWNSLVQGPATSTNGYIPSWNGTIGNKLGTGYQVLTTVGDPGVDTALVTDQGIREAIAAAISGGVSYKGSYNATTNVPDLETPAGGAVFQGDMYTVTVAGDFFTDTVAVGDVLIAENDDPSTLAEWTIVAREWDESFLELGDTPASYTGTGGYMVMVDSTPDALEFVNPGTYALSNFSNDLYTAAALTRTNDTNVTLTLGGTPATALLQATSLTMGWTGQLAATRGGTGIGSYAVGDLLYASTTTALSRLAAVPAGSFLRAAGTSTAPAWSSMTIPDSITEDSILVANSADTLVALQVTNGQSIRLNAGGTAWEAFTPSSGIGNHNLLNGSEHPDTAVAAVSRGSIITGQTATPVWDELTVGGATTFLYSDGTDVSWKDVDFADLGTTPTTLSGYGISDSMTNFDAALSDGSFMYVGDAPTSHTLLSHTISGETAGHVLAADSATTYSIRELLFSEIGSTPTTLSGYGISDSMASFDTALSDGNFAYATGAFHDGFSDFVGDEHIDHTTVSISAGNGLTGGGTIAANRTLSLNINGLTTETDIADGDYVPFWDITATATNKKITFANFVTQVESSLDTSGYATVKVGDVPLGATPTITHSLNKTEITDLIVQVWRQADSKLVSVEATAATADSITLAFGSAAINPSLGTFRYVITAVQE